MKIFKQKVMLLMLLAFTFVFSNISFAAEKPEVKAEAAILIEPSTGKVLFEKNADKKMYPASMTKLLTAIIALDNFSPDDVILVGNEINEVSLGFKQSRPCQRRIHNSEELDTRPYYTKRQ